MNPPEPHAHRWNPAAAEALVGPLNPAQREAVTYGSGALLVLAGAGSGKTRVITHRLAHLIVARGVQPSRIIAVTFTNKAAGEMRERVLSLIGERSLGAWIGTFHALCLRILRRDGGRIGIPPNFGVYDTDDQLAIVRRVLEDVGAERARSEARRFLARISRAKNAMRSASEVEARASGPDGRLEARVHSLYEEALKRAGALDFDDLLLRALELLDSQGDVRTRYAEACEHLLVDEYQDTNRPQYLLVRRLSSVHRNVCVVGDEDQSIYRFRGAEIRNILDFEHDHPGACVVKLEENYRSTANILEAAGSVISRNRDRKGKALWTRNDEGSRIEVCLAPDEREEAAWVSRRIQALRGAGEGEEIAVLYRTNAQSRPFEEILRRDGIPYRVVGALQFYARKEIRDLLAYLKLVASPGDDAAFRRIVNTPPRGVGEATLGILEESAARLGIPLAEATARALEEGLLAARACRALRSFLEAIESARARAASLPVPALMEEILRTTGFREHLARAHPGEGAERTQNVEALVSAAVEYEEETEEPSLRGFLDRSALVADADDAGGSPGVSLLTVHCAKGLEFPAVFLAGMEEGVFPHARAATAREDLEEERRLCYVAMTRARNRLFLSHAELRRTQGALLPARPSRFLDELPEELVERVFAEEGRYEAGEPRRRRFEPPLASSAARAAARAAREGRAAAASEPPFEVAEAYPVGSAVVHPLFGPGKIVDREGAGKTLKLTIRFAGAGAKKILPSYVQLRVLSES